MTQYVQHISGQGEKWKVRARELHYCSKVAWQVECSTDEGPLYLPKSEYRLCDPPERWVDVTGKCDFRHESTDFKGYLEHVESALHRNVACTLESRGYRLRKVEHTWQDSYGNTVTRKTAFIVEKREIKE